jgi:hypothetical protein
MRSYYKSWGKGFLYSVRSQCRRNTVFTDST